jgi:hypothetical protein
VSTFIRGTISFVTLAGLTACGSDHSGGVTGPPPPPVDPCAVRTPYPFGTTTDGTFTTSDCPSFDKSFIDSYTTTIDAPGAYLFTETSTAVDTYLFLDAEDGSLIAENDDASSVDSNSSIKALIPAGNYVIAANTFDTGETGDYKLSSSKTTESIENCERVFIARGMTTAQNLAPTDCTTNGFYSDDVLFFIHGGQSVTVSVNSTAFDSYVEIYSRAGLVASNDDKSATSTDAEVTYTAPTTDYYLISPTSKLSGAAGTTGAYTMIVK